MRRSETIMLRAKGDTGFAADCKLCHDLAEILDKHNDKGSPGTYIYVACEG